MYNCDHATIDLRENVAVLELERYEIFNKVLQDFIDPVFPARELAVDDGGFTRISPEGREMLVATEMTSPIAFQRRLVERLITTQSTERIENEKVCSIYPY